MERLGERLMENEVVRPDESNALKEISSHLKNMVAIDVEVYFEIATQALIMSRESDLRTGNARITSLTKEKEKPVIEVAVTAGVSGLVAFVAKYLLEQSNADSNFLQPLREWFQGLDDYWQLVGVATIAAFVFCLLFLIVQRLLGHIGRNSRFVVMGLQKITDLYVPHSALNGRIQEARQLRVRTEAKMHTFAGLTWKEIDAKGGTEIMRECVDVLAESDLRRGQHKAAYEDAGGDLWLEILRSGLRGELPAFICLYLHSAKKYRGDEAKRHAELRRWRKEAIKFCKAENNVFGRTFPEKQKTYQAMRKKLALIESFSAADLQGLLDAWREEYPSLGINVEEHEANVNSLFWK